MDCWAQNLYPPEPFVSTGLQIETLLRFEGIMTRVENSAWVTGFLQQTVELSTMAFVPCRTW